MRNAGRIAAFALTTLVVCSPAAHADPVDPVARYHAANQAFIQEFRRSGAHDPAVLAQNLRELESIAAAGGGERRARAMLEIGFIHRVSNQFAPAAAAYAQAAAIAVPLGRNDLAFDAWIGLARTRGLLKDHGAAATALDQAMAAAGPQPTPKQHFEIALDTAQFADDRGEIEAALTGSLDALQQAPGPEDRLDALRQVDDALLELVEECDYRRLRDSRTNADPPGEEWGGCRRAITVGETTSSSVARAADALGWKGMVRVAGEMNQQFKARRALIDSLQASELPDPGRFPQYPEMARFTPRNSRDVLVHRGEFARQYLAAEMPSSILTPQLRALIERTVAEATSAQGRDSPGNLDLRAQLADTPGGATSRGTDLLTQAAHLMMAERTSFFDARRRGTVLERQAGVFTELALRLLALHQDEAAFAVLELTRARGLAELAELLARDNIPAGDRAWLARQVRLDAEAGAVADKVVESVVGQGSLVTQGEMLAQWERHSDERRLSMQGHSDFRDRLVQTSFVPANLADLQRATTRSGIPVLLYWVANPNVYAWYVGPHGSDFRIIFLPRAALRQKIVSLNAMRDPSAAFDAAAARHLYLYLIAPFDELLDSNQVIIVPQGDMIDLPFETLIEPQTGQFLIERRVVSYALNATLAVRSLTRPAPSIRHVTAIVDPAIDDSTHEYRSIRSLGRRLDVQFVDASDIDLDGLRKSLPGTESAHILVHGAFRAAEPVLSTLRGTLQNTNTAVSAADLLSIPLRGTKLVVMSACESGELEHRVSNEVYGFPWAVLAAGAENVVTSRWLVNGASNSRWMGAFYEAISAGASPAQAAAAAVRSMLKSDRGKPYYWAAMQVTGR